jgi:hypothetical protein
MSMTATMTARGWAGALGTDPATRVDRRHRQRRDHFKCDYQRFGGFLKVSVDELIIALRDDRHLLNDPGGLLAGNHDVDEAHEADVSESGWSPYPDGFSAGRFVEVIETEAVWDLQA